MDLGSFSHPSTHLLCPCMVESIVSSHTRLLLIAAVVSFCSNWQFAYQITYVNTSVNAFRRLAEFAAQVENGSSARLNEAEWSTQWSTIVSSFYPGTIVGFLVTPLLVAQLGVKRSMQWLSGCAVAGCGVHFAAPAASASGSLALVLTLCLGRFLIGIQAGSSLCLLPLYVLQVAPASCRPFINTFQQVSQAAGTLLGLLIGSEVLLPMGEMRFIGLQIAAVIPCVVFLSVLLITPPTPVQLTLNGDSAQKILSSLSYYQGDEGCLKQVQKDAAALSRGSSRSSGGGIPLSSWKGFAVGAAAAVSYAFTADDLIDTFSAQILTPPSNSTAAPDDVSKAADLISVWMGLMLLVASCAGSLLMDRFGRRRLLLGGLIGSAASNALVAFFPTSQWLVTVAFSMTKIFIGLGAGAPAWFLTSELVDPANVSLLQSLSTGLLLTSTMLVTFFYMQIEMAIGSYSLLVLASGPALVLSAFLAAFLPETKDRSPEEIQRLLSARTLTGLKTKQPTGQIYGTL